MKCLEDTFVWHWTAILLFTSGFFTNVKFDIANKDVLSAILKIWTRQLWYGPFEMTRYSVGIAAS